MTVIRRVLIAIVGLLLLLDVAALAWIKTKTEPTPSEDKSKIVFWIDDAGEAKAATESLKELGYEPIVKNAERNDFVEADFRLELDGVGSPLKPTGRILRKRGYASVTWNEDGTVLDYGKVFATRAEAEQTATNIGNKEGVYFSVVPGKKKTVKQSHRVILLEVPNNKIDEVVGPIELEYTVAEVDEEPIIVVEDDGDEVEE